MVILNENQVKKLKVGDMVAYKERSGDLQHFLFRAKVIGIYPRFLLLNCAATRNPLKEYEDCDRFFNTCFNFDDAGKPYSGSILFDYDSVFDDFYNYGDI